MSEVQSCISDHTSIYSCHVANTEHTTIRKPKRSKEDNLEQDSTPPLDVMKEIMKEEEEEEVEEGEKERRWISRCPNMLS